MAYFLKVSKQQNRTYLSIYESFYSPDVKGTKQRSYRKIGNLDKLIASGIDDPIAYYKKEVDELNAKRKEEKLNNKINQKLISNVSPEKYLGYFPLANILNVLDVEEHFKQMQSTRDFKFNLYDVITSLVFARAVAPLSKHKTFLDILPSLYKPVNFSYDQLLSAVEFIGSEYEKFIEIFTVATQENYGTDTNCTYFDCTNFYFEIDKETDFKRKGPSKENRRDPIVSMGLLLDANMIPIGMRMFPGNESEKPVLRNIISSLKDRNNIDGRTIQIADKGLNCAQNIIEAVDNNDGYIFSKSIKQLKETEKTWVFLDKDFVEVKDSNGELLYKYKSCIDSFTYEYTDKNSNKITKTVKEKRIVTYNPKLASKKHHEINKMVEKAYTLSTYAAKKNEYGECSKYVNFTSTSGDKVTTTINHDAIDKDRQCAGYNMIITSEYNMDDTAIYEAYHNLWRIEESFRVMKSDFDARPVYLQKENSIKGHFLICYITVLLTRILQFKVLDNKYPTSAICNFYKEFKVLSINNGRYINMSRSSDFITYLAVKLHHPITNYYLTDKQIKLMHTR